MTISTESIKNDMRRAAPVIGIGALMGLFFVLFFNNIALSAMKTMPQMAAMYTTMYFTATGLMPAIIAGLGGCVFILLMPRLKGAPDDGPVTDHIPAILLVPLIVELVLMLAHMGFAVYKLGSLDSLGYLPLAYLGMHLLSVAFASFGVLGCSLFDDGKRSLGFAGALTGWCFLASMLGLLSLPMMVTLGAGSEAMGVFYYTTVVGFVDVDSLVTIGTSDPDLTCVWKYLGLAVLDALMLTIAALVGRRRSTV